VRKLKDERLLTYRYTGIKMVSITGWSVSY